MTDPKDFLSSILPPIPQTSNQNSGLPNIFPQLSTIIPVKPSGIKLKIATPRTLAEIKLKQELSEIAKMDLDRILARIIPTLSSLAFTEGKELETAFLFMDIRQSSNITKTQLPEDVIKIYKLFFRAMAFAGKNYGGQIGGYAGDRIMIVFPFKPDEAPRGNAVKTAIYMQYVLKYILNPILTNQYAHPLTAGIGIDFGETFVIKVGQQGEGNNDRVWAGDAVNSASKLADKEEGIYISANVYNGLHRSLKEGDMIWLPPIQGKDLCYEYLGSDKPI